MRNLGLSIPASSFLLSTVTLPAAYWDSALTPSLPATLSLSRPSLATLFNSTGKMTYAPNNALTYSTDLTNAAWIKSLATVTGGVADPFGGNNACTYTATGNGAIQQTGTVSSCSGNRKFIVSVWVKLNGPALTGICRLYTAANTSPITLSLTSSWQQFYIAGNGASNDGSYFVLNLTSAGDKVDIYGATLSAVTYETSPRSQDQVVTTSSAYYGPRISYSPLDLSLRGLHIEEPRTNLAINSASASASNAWAAQGGTKSTDGTLDPSGMAATKLSLTATTTAHSIFSTTANVSVVSGTKYAASWYVRAGTHSNIIVSCGASANWSAAVFDISGTADIAATQTASNTDTTVSGQAYYLGNGWFRLVLVFTASATGGRYFECGAAAGATGNSITGFGESIWTSAGTETMYVSMPQVEAGSFQTSFVPTGSASASRAGETYNFVGPALTALQNSAFTVLVEMQAANASLPSTSRVVNFQSGGEAPIFISSDGSPSSFVAAGTLSATPGGGGLFSTGLRVGCAAGPSGRSLVANNGAVSTDTRTFAAVASAQLGSQNGSTDFATGYYKSFAIFGSKISDLSLQSKSANGSSYLV